MNPILPPAAPRPPAAITIIGLGPGAADDLTLAAWRAWQTAPRILRRTRRHIRSGARCRGAQTNGFTFNF